MALGSEKSSALLPVSQQVSKTLWSSSESRISVPEEVREALKSKLRVSDWEFVFNKRVTGRSGGMRPWSGKD